MHNCHHFPIDSGAGSSNLIAIIAIIISVLSLISSIYLIYLTKRLEILYQEFESLCIKNVENIFSGLDNIFDQNELSLASDHRSHITTIMTELQGFLISLRDSVYSKIDVQSLIDIMELFTEKIYEGNNAKLVEFKGDYYSTKLKIYNSLYNHAIEKEIGMLLLFKKKRTI